MNHKPTQRQTAHRTRAPKIPLHPRIRGVVSQSTHMRQVAYRWTAVLASSVTAVWVGAGADKALAGDQLNVQWWVGTTLCALAAALFSGLAVAHSHRTQADAERALRRITQESWFALGPTRMRERTGQMLDLATNGAMRAARYRGGFLSATLASFTSPLIVCLVMGVSISWTAAGLMVLLVVVGPILMEVFNRSTRGAGNRFRISQMFLRQSFLQGIKALESLVYAGAGKAYAQDLAHDNEIHRRKIMRLLAGNQTLIFFMDIVFSMAAFMLATVIGGLGVNAGTLSVGQALALLMLTVILVSPVDLIGQFFYIGIGGRATQRQLSALAAEVDEYTAAASRHDAPQDVHCMDTDRGRVDGESVIRFDEVTVGWEQGQELLEKTSFQVGSGEQVALIGPSGVGKSTLSAVMQGYLEPHAGTVHILGHHTAHTPWTLLRDNMAVVEQRTYLFNGSIADNLRIAKPTATEEELFHALEEANLAEDVRAFPDGLNTQVGDHGARLSGGQAQRLAIARAFLKDAPILILDEPTSQVDLTGEAAILDALERIAHGRTVVMIAHRRAAIQHVGRVLAIANKKVAEQ